MGQEIKTVGDVIAIIKRRKHYLIWPAVAIFLLSMIVAYTWPPTYSSTSTILIEDQEIPREYVMTTVSSYAEHRLQTINQRIMSTTRLTEIINKLNLYSDLRQKKTMEEIIGEMRKDIKLEMISGDVIDRRAGRKTVATIAFSISYEGRNPAVVQQVTNVLTSLYLEENLRVREQQTEGATRFMEDERKAVEEQMAEIDRQIADFKQKNVNALPELAQYNYQSIDRIELTISQLKNQLKELKEKETYLQTQLASVPSNTRLQELQTRLKSLESQYTDKHPDVKKTKVEIAELEKKLRTSGKNPTEPDNPTHVTLSAQLASIRSEIKAVKLQISDAESQRNIYNRRIASSAKVEEEYKLLLAKRNNLMVKYDDISKKYLESKTASGLEKDQMGERFTLIDAARLPEKPVQPNRPAIIFIGLVLGIGAGVCSTALKEFSDQSVRTAGALSKALGLPVLAVIPDIVTTEGAAKSRMKIGLILIGIALAAVVFAGVFHFFVMDLDVLWAKILRRMG
ncbi:MAG TPA: chain-length determining protein [Syntrophales bacterium]|nr:chain-length determining protein [Syntrophales bacterium]HPI56328.1 chain-length determining protein [Syntrophales bacterium]HPN24284.1 chain-length determining protein [Syntrophales bacterium]HQM28637.1 chain-length determining protein [Syntrophales bacterium]